MTEITGFESAADYEGGGSPVAETDLSAAALRPLLEGARARGVADVCELLGVGAVLLDRSGGVLHLSSAASALVGGALRLTGGHLVGGSPQAKQDIERAIALALAGSASENVIAADGARSLRVRVMPMPRAVNDEAQLLKAVLFMNELEDCAADASPRASRAA